MKDAVEFYMTGITEEMQGLSESYTALAISSGATWSFVTIPDFESVNETASTFLR